MPNIKIYGVLKDQNVKIQRKKAEELRMKIKKIFENELYAKDIVVTVISSTVSDLNENEQPYIQLELNCMRGYKHKVEKLKTLGMDVQIIKLYDFIPKA